MSEQTLNVPQAPRRSRGKVETTSTERLQKLVDLYSLVEVAKEFHHSKGTIAKWLHQKQMPKFAGLMCEALERRRRTEPVALILHPDTEQRAALMPLLNQLGVRHWEIK